MSEDSTAGEYEALKALWPTVSDTDKAGIVSRLEGLLHRANVESDVPLSTEIENTTATIRQQLGTGRER